MGLLVVLKRCYVLIFGEQNQRHTSKHIACAVLCEVLQCACNRALAFLEHFGSIHFTPDVLLSNAEVI